MIRRDNLEDLYPLAPMQEGMLLHALLEPQSRAYREQVAYRVRGTLDVARLEACWKALARRHDCLRTVFVHEKVQRPLQMVLKDVAVRFQVEDLRGLDPGARDARAAAFRDAERGDGFDLAAEPPSRTAVLLLGDDTFEIVWTFHHIILDGWSVGLLLADLLRMYTEGGARQVPAPAAYSRYIQWIEARDAEGARRFWHGELAGFVGPTSIPSSRPGDAPQAYAAMQRDFSWTAAETAALERLAREHAITMGSLVLALWALVLARYQPDAEMGRHDLAFGLVVSGRPPALAEVDTMLGLFINTAPLRVRYDEGEPLGTFLARLQVQVLAAQEHAYLPLSEMQLAPGMIDHAVGFENFPRDARAAASIVQGEPGFRIESIRAHTQTAYDLNVVFAPGQRLSASFHFNASRHAPVQVERLFAQLRTLSAAASAAPHASVGDLEILPEEERASLRSFAGARVERCGPATLCEAIALRACEAPAAPAVLEGERVTSYGELDSRSGAIAAALRAGCRLAHGARVAVVLERGVDLPASWWGIMRAGAVFVPIDPALPDDRIAFMVADSECALVLTNARRREALHGLVGAAVDDVEELVARGASLEAPAATRVADCAYVIYTSGSTGTPKGVAVGHAGVLNVMAHLAELHPVARGDRVVFFASPSFDASIWEMGEALCHGAALVVADHGTVSDPARFGALLRESACTIAVLPPSYLRLVPSRDLASLKLLATAGEAAHPATAEEMSRHAHFVNLYGPTEASIHVTTYEVAPGERFTRSVPIGRPIPNVDALVLDRRGRLAPVGAPGELCASGVCVAIGYVKRPELDAERFVPHPFAPGERMYRTGDIVRWLDDGTLEFAGRADDQVKIRGHRVELGEIQARLLGLPGVRQAAVVVEHDREGADGIAAYVVPAASLAGEDVRASLRRALPEYMVPSRVIMLAELPLTPQGKIDRAALPKEAARNDPSIDAPGDPLEARLAGIWQSALGVNVVGVHDSFFDLGGHSLTAMRLASRVRRELGYALEVRELFAHPTIAGMAQLLRGRERIDAAPIRRLADTADFEVSHAQQRLWLLHHLSGGVAAYNIGGAFALDGAIDANALEHAVAALVARHESLRTSFVQVQGRPRQKVHPPGRGPIVELLDVSALPDPEAAALEVFREARARVFDLALAPLARFMLVTEAPSQHLLGVVLHHIVADEWSVQVMTRELSRLYASALSHGEAALGALAVQHRDVAAWLNSRAVKRDADYWRKQLGGSLPVLDLPIDRSRPPQRSFRGATRAFRVAPSTVAGLAAIARDARATRFMVLVAAVKVLLARYSGQQDIVVGHPAAGRDHPDLEGQVGLFVNTLALRDSVRPQASFRELVEAIRHTVLAALEHQAYPFDRIVSELGVARDASRDPVFDVMVAYDRASGEDLRLPGASVRALASDAGTSKFDLLFAFHERDTTLEGAIEYSTDLFDEATIARIEGHLATLMAAMVEAPDRAIGEHPLLTAGELRAIASPPRLERDPAESLVSRFDRVVARSPGDIAAVHGGERLTYRALDARATALARELAAAGAGPGIVAGLLVERSLDMLVGMLGILKSGSAYLPLDPALPAARLAAMMSDAKAPVVASVRRLESLAGALGARALYLDARAQTARVDVLPQARGHDLAYVMYTSGSTGRPNGVLVEHRNVLALLDAFEHLAPRREALAGTALCPSGFDVSVWEIFSCLCSGGTLHLLASETAADPRKIAGYFVDQGITSAYLPPALIDDVAGELARVAGARLDRLLVGVEPIRQGSLQRLCDAVPGLRIVNGYGPTEATVCATFHRFEPGSDPALRTPIGRAAWGYQVFLLDGSMQHVPPGVAGEIHVGGAGLARGYAGNAALTASRFVPNPFSTDGERLYRTGDLARALADGSIEFLGRADHQVKVRGFRIEPGEVEAALRQHRAIREACVLSRSAPSGGSQLVAFIAAELAPDAGRELRLFVKERLPEYMVPAAFVIRDILPRTANGKVDREALALLPLPEIVQGDATPVNATEEMLQPLWRDVLGLDVVGCDDDFFDLGGHSLLATRLIARIHEACDIELPLRALFEAPTIRAVAAHIEAARERAPGEAALDAIPRSPRDTPLPLSFAQQRLWFVEELEPGPTYVVPAALELRGILDAERLEAALNALIARHEALRTRFVAIDGMPVQEVLAERPIQLAREDLRQADAASADEEVRRRAALLAAQPFDLANDALLRAVLVWLDDERHTLLISIHHIVVDGWSMGVLIRELAALYAGEELAPLPIQYADFAAWQHDPGRLESVIAPQLAYWRRELAGSPPLLALPTDRPRDPRRAKRAAVERFALDAALASRVRERARELEATPFMLLMAALDVVLARAAGQDDLAVGTPIANRTRTQIEGLIGFFANTIVIRVRIDEEMPFAAVVARVREAALSAYAHQEAPFEQVVEALQPERTLGHTPLFQVLFVMQNLPLAPVEIPGLRIRALEQPATTAKFDLTLAIEEREGGFACAIEYDADLFDAATVRSLAEGFRALTAAAVADPATAVGRLALMSPESRRALIERQSRNPPASSPHDTVTAFIAAQVARTPAATAVEDGAIALSYRELDERANQLAHHLRGIGADRGERIGLCMPRSAGQLVALLAILKSGAAVVPLDPGLPPDRLATMLREAAVRFVVTRGAVVPGRSIDLDLDGERAAIARQPVTPADVTASSEDLLYVVFTSGSTGVPKAVLLPHRVLANLIAWGRAGQGFERPARTLQFTPISFDVSFQEIFTCWSSGGAIVVIDEDRRRDSAALLDFLRESGIERLFLPFVALQGLAEAASGRPRALLPSALRRIITAGEQLRATSALTELFTRLGHCELHNHYGPSETHVLTAHRLAGPPSSWPPLPPIGYAIAGARLYVLDRHRELVPPGMAGELYAAGIPVAQGYANQPELTAERFLPDPFAGEGVMYRTGDRVRMRADGDYEYLGRGDTQVKVRGLRIEPGEIEVALARHSQVADAAVVPDERSASVRLVAYVVPAAGSDLDIAALRRHLREILPEPMVPALFAILPKLPLGASGKVDRRALAALASLAAVEERRTVPPRTPTERVLGELYAEVLEIPVVGADDGFFELGGHSLLATRLIARVRRAFGVQLPLRRLFEAPTVAELARVIDEAPRAAAEAAPLVAVDRARPLPLSFAQERLWFLDRLGMGAAYNMPAALRLSGALDVGALGKAIDALASRHEILRTRFVERAGVPAQMVCMAPKDAMQRIDLSRLGDAAQASAVHGETLRLAREPFDLAAGPAVRWTLLRLGPRENVLILVLHHILADGWSIAILTRELTTLYCAFAAGRPSPLPPLALQYGDFACWQRSTAAGDASQRQYWARQLADAAPDIHLAIDRSRSAAPSLQGGTIRFAFDASLTASLKMLAERQKATLHATLLAAFAVLLARASGQEDLTIGTPVGHRPRAELEPLVGLFLNVLPIRIACGMQATSAEVCQAVQATMLDAFAHGDLPFEQIVEVAGGSRQDAHAPLFQVMFVLQGGAASIALPGIDIAPLELESTLAKYDLTLAMEETGGGLAGTLEYAADRLDAETAAELAAAYRTIARAMAENEGTRVVDLRLGEASAPPMADEHDFAFDEA